MADWQPILAISIPGDPMPAPRPRRSASGGVFMPTEYRRHLDGLKWQLRQARGGWRPEGGASFAMKLTFYRRTRARVDGDNLAKAYLDAANGIIYRDDSMVDKLIVTKLLDRANPRTELRIWVAAAQPSLLEAP